MDFGFTAVPCIVVLCYLSAEIFKCFDKNEDHKRFLPVISGCLGLVLGLVAFFTTPSVISAATEPFTAAAIGAVSGFAATGINQVYKQAKKGVSEVIEDIVDGEDASK